MSASAASKAVAAPGEATIVVTRTVDAPRDLVWKVWTDAAHIAKWWGPNGFTNTIHAMDVRPGGSWLFVMHGPDGANYDNKIVYREIVKPERLVYDHGDPGDPDQFRTTVTFKAEGNRTHITMTAVFPSVAARDGVARFGAVEGGAQTLDKMAVYVGSLQSQSS